MLQRQGTRLNTTPPPRRSWDLWGFFSQQAHKRQDKMRRMRRDTHLPPGAVQVGKQQLDDVALVNAEGGPTVGSGDSAVGPDHHQPW